MKRIALGITTFSLLGCAILALLWWTILAVHRPPFDMRLVAFLLVIAIIQVASWVAVLRLSIRAHSIRSVGFAVHVGVLGLALLVSHLANGITPALGTPVALVVLLIAVLSLFAARPSSTAPRVT
jgi:hypothetical protein